MLHTLRRAAQVSKSAPTPASSAPLYDSKPRWWARWAYGLLALDIIFTTSNCDMIMNRWTRRVTVEARDGDKQEAPGAAVPGERQWELRPFWQRLGLAAGQLVVGAAIGAAVMAFRDRTVWRMRVLQAALPPARTTPKPTNPKPTNPKSTNPRPTTGPLAPPRDQRWLQIETGSGRTKKYMMQHCVLVDGRDETEMAMRVHGIRGQYWVGMTRAKVLGQEGLPASEVRRLLLQNWGLSDAQINSAGKWTSGPVAQ